MAFIQIQNLIKPSGCVQSGGKSGVVYKIIATNFLFSKPAFIADAVFHFIAIIELLIRTNSWKYGRIEPGNSADMIGNLTCFKLELFVVRHVLPATATAHICMLTFRSNPIGTFFQQFQHFSFAIAFSPFYNSGSNYIIGHSTWNKNGETVNFGHAFSFKCGAFDG